MKDGARLMRSTVSSINAFLEELDRPKTKVMDKVKGLK